MKVQELLDLLDSRQIQIHADQGELVVRASRGAMDAALVDSLKQKKSELLVELQRRQQVRPAPVSDLNVALARNGARNGDSRITPQMLTLVSLSQAAIDAIVAGVEGGAANVQDIYPLAPLQAGLLFHHLLKRDSDVYVEGYLLAFGTRTRLESFLSALQKVIDRHDILRTAIAWEGLDEPVQVVRRRAKLPVEFVELDAAQGEIEAQFAARFDPRQQRLDLRRAPLLICYATHDKPQGRWLLRVLAHHIAIDHMAMELLVEEAQAIEQGLLEQLPQPVPFRNFVAQARLGVSEQQHEAFFKQMLGDIDTPTAPFGLLDVRGGSAIVEAKQALPQQLSRTVRQQARKLGVSAASLMHLAWALVLARLTGQRAVVFGTVLFGRMQSAGSTERMMGLLINTLPVRISVTSAGVEAGLKQTHALLMQLLRHEHAPLSLAQRCSGVSAPTPLFTSLLNYRYNDAEPPAARTTGVQLQVLSSHERTNYPITLSVDDLGEGFALTAKVSEPIAPQRVCEFMQTALEHLTDALRRAPATALQNIQVLSALERQRVLTQWNATQTAYPREYCIHELFEAQVQKTPSALALQYADEQLSYAELNCRANRLAHQLRQLGVTPDCRVALCVQRGLDMVIALLAVLKAGGAYVPLDPSYPAQRLAFMLADSAPAALITDSGSRAALGESLAGLTAGSIVIDLQRDARSWAHQPDCNPDRLGLDPTHLAYVIYTSGSTGTPKGVMVEHRSLVNLALSLSSMTANSGAGAWGWMISYAFDGSLKGLTQMMLGRTLRIVGDRQKQDSASMRELLQQQDVALLDCTPTLLEQWLGFGLEDALPDLVVGGEALSPSLWQRLLQWQQRRNRRAINVYGPTECCVDSTACVLDGESPHIGRALPNVRVYILDAALQPLPVGVSGELYIGGAGVARGYLHNPQLSAARFLPDPFVAGERLYKSGDLGRWLEDGSIEYLGRNDFQAKVRGFRIELGEIEAQLSLLDGVRETVVLVRQDAPGDQRLVAYYTGVELPAQTLRQHALSRLPQYMVPAAYVHLEQWPLTANGKLDRRALPIPSTTAVVMQAHESPHGTTEQTVAAIWSELLGIEHIGRHDDFFHLGGHSLLAVRLVSRLQSALGVSLALDTLFERPTLSAVAAAVTESRVAPLPAIARVSRDGPLALSFAQQRLWFLAQVEADSTTYHIPVGLRLIGPLHRVALRRSLDRLLARHEALRTVFGIHNGHPHAKLLPELCGFTLIEQDLRDAPDAQRQLDRLRVEEAYAPFDLVRGPLIRGRLIQMAAAEHVLLLTQHHIVCDGWSMGILAREISALYRAFAAGHDDPLAPLSIQYPDYSAWQRSWLSDDRLQDRIDYWRGQLRNAPVLLELPTDRPRPPEQSFAGAAVEVLIDAELTRGLRQLGQQHGTTLFMTMLAAWAIVLARLSGQKDLVIGTPVANRNREEVEPLIGLFLNNLALRLDMSDEPTVAGLLARVRETTLAAQRHQDLPFERVVDIVQPPRRLTHAPLFQVKLAWQDDNTDQLDFPGLRLSPLAGLHQTVSLDLELDLAETAQSIAGTLTYVTALFDAATIERQRGYLICVLRAMVADAGQTAARIALLSHGERQLLDGWNDTATSDSPYHSIHALFAARASETPRAPAVVFQGTSVSYAQLDAQANQLAHHLRSLGIGPEVVVGVCVERSPQLLVSLLGILKAGGAYLPLDPDYPTQRLGFMLDDATVAVLVTQSTLAERLPAHWARVVNVDTDWPSIATQPTTAPNSDTRPSNLAYVIYTSGSTGNPKGVMVEHGGVVNLAQAQADLFGVTPSSRVLQFASISFDASVFEIMMALSRGAALYLPDLEQRHPPAVFDYIAEHAVTHATLPPALLASRPSTARWGALQSVVLAGEAPGVGVVKSFSPHTNVFNAYGPTEATVWATTWLRPKDFAGTSVPTGRPIANARIYLLDACGAPVPLGAVGEIHIGGVGVARGYLNLAELTAQRFMADPFAAEPGARMYRTGDLARYQPDGNLEFVGRSDFQVKVRGFRVEPGEIEARLAEHPLVREALVIVREDVPGDQRLVAYVTSRSDAPADVAQLREHLAHQLPDHMVPAAFVRLAQWPLTLNGKIDREALPVPDAQATAQQAYQAPQGQAEQTLAVIWSELLGLERIGRHDHFFQLGGHSLLVVSLIERMRREGLHADVRALFTAPTLAALAAQSGAQSDEVVVPPNLIPPEAVRITPSMLPLVTLTQLQIDAIVATVEGGAANVHDIYPLAPLQEGMLFHHLLHPKADAYLASHLLLFHTRARLDSFLSALQQVIDRHDILRTGIVWDGLEEAVQVVRRRVQLPVEELALDPARGAIAGQLAERYHPRRYHLDITQAPLMRCHVAQDAVQGRWVLSLLTHHLAIDHTTLELLVEEARAFEQGNLHVLRTPAPFRNFIAQARLGVSRQEHAAFFERMLGDIDAPTAPFDLFDVRGDGSAIGEVQQELPAELSRSVRQHARRLGVSPASLMHLAWAMVLARITGQRDVVFGTVLFGRMQGGAHADRVLGLFINTLPVRISVADRSVAEDLKQTHELLIQLLRHEHAPLTLAQSCSGVSPPTPLFTSLLNYRYGAEQTPESQSVDEQIEVIGSQERTNYPLTLSVDDGGDSFSLKAQVSEPIAPQRVCAFMQTALEELLHALQHTPERSTREIDVLPACEREQVLVEWNATARTFASDLPVHQLLEAQAARAPQATALVQGERRVSYGDLNAQANHLAQRLRTLGVRPDSRVAICMDRSVEMVVSLLATLKAGGAYVPLDPNYPVERLDSMLRDCEPVALLTHPRVGASLHAQLCSFMVEYGHQDQLIDLTNLGQSSLQDPGNLPLAESLSHQLAYVVYTSGSTGQPKGVMIEQRSLSNLVAWHTHTFHLEATSRCSSTAGVGFDASTWEIWPVLCAGGSLHLPPVGKSPDPQELLQWWQGQTLDVSFLVTPLAELAYASGAVNSGVRTLLIGGDRLRRWPQTLPAGQRLVNNYGPTETTVVATSGQLSIENAVLHIGQPIANTRIYILDEQLRPVPVGVGGELYIGGVQVARGYLNQPQLSAQRFIADPFVAGGRLYKSGDLGRWLADGSIEYLGRNDFQVKVRGFRIELGEIEARLSRLEGVREVVVLAREDAPEEQRLVAYYTGVAMPANTLREHALSGLPQYMVPAAYVHLEQLPLTPNGKLDRKALPAPEDDVYASQAFEAPQGHIEQTLARLWSQLLKVERVGRHDNFFELGGHSLLAVQLLSRIRQELQVEVALSALFEHPALAALAQCVAGAGRLPLPPIVRVERQGPQPLSLAQQRLWFLTHMDGGSAYHIYQPVRLSGELDQSALRRALHRIVQRHEALRTRFCLIDGTPQQRIAEPQQVHLEQFLEEHDLRGQQSVAAQRLSLEHAQTPFDLERELPVRALLLRVAEREYLLQVVMHHIASDGWSVGILLNELSQLYGAYLQQRPEPLDALPIQYADYAAWQRGLAGQALQQQSEFWRDNLRGAPVLLELSTDRPRPAQQDYAGATIEVRLNERLSSAVKQLSQRHGVTAYMTLLASWALLLGRLSQQQEVMIGTPVAGRNRAEIEPLIGFFVNTLALRVEVNGQLRVSELLERTKAQVLSAQQHQDLPFEQVVELVQPPRSLAHTPLFQVMFDWQNAPDGQLQMPGLSLTPVDTPMSTAQFDLTLSLREDAAGIGGVLNYATALFDRATVQRYLDCWLCLLESLVSAAGQRIDRLSWLPAAERERVLFEWNATARAYPNDSCVHELFEAQAARTPDAVAVVQGAHRLSYGELNARANQLAHHLRVLGVRADARVAVCLQRSPEMVIALLATFKAGGVYVPLDADYPGERIEYMLSDSAPVVVLTVGTARQIVAPWLPAGVPILDLRADVARWCERPERNLAAPALGLTAEHLAYIIYTSGSTGLPKGVMIEHRALLNYTLEAIRWFELSSRDTVLQQNSLNFDLSLEESLPALLAGATLVPSVELFGVSAADEQSRPRPSVMPRVIPSVVHLTAAHWHSLVSEWSESGTTPAVLSSVRLINVTGDAVSMHKLQQWETIKPAATRLINTYGPTEATVSCSAAYLHYEARASRASIGKPFANTRIYILDEQRQPVPVGVAGELYIGGVQVGRGYWNQPQLTAERFIEDPFVPAGRLYKSGDLARWRADGTLEHLGRNDFQVKVRGFRIELGEIEAQLGQRAGVREVVVQARASAGADQQLVAYYTGEVLSAAQLREHALSGLPQHMVPAAYVHLDRFPLTPNGKLDRVALPAPQEEAYASRAYEAPQGPIEQALADLWSQLLKMERVGRHDNFFELGGHSLLAVSLIERMRRQALHADVTLLFTAPTLADMAASTVKLKEIVL